MHRKLPRTPTVRGSFLFGSISCGSVKRLDYAQESVGTEVKVALEFMVDRFADYDSGILSDVEADSPLYVHYPGVGSENDGFQTQGPSFQCPE